MYVALSCIGCCAVRMLLPRQWHSFRLRLLPAIIDGHRDGMHPHYSLFLSGVLAWNAPAAIPLAQGIITMAISIICVCVSSWAACKNACIPEKQWGGHTPYPYQQELQGALVLRKQIDPRNSGGLCLVQRATFVHYHRCYPWLSPSDMCTPEWA